MVTRGLTAEQAEQLRRLLAVVAGEPGTGSRDTPRIRGLA